MTFAPDQFAQFQHQGYALAYHPSSIIYRHRIQDHELNVYIFHSIYTRLFSVLILPILQSCLMLPFRAKFILETS